jgi:Family of unknown function (DUF5330)
MGLFRLAAMVAVGVSLLPADRDKQAQLYQRAASAATWTMTFCDRNANTCTQATNLWADFSKKAEFGAKLAYEVMQKNDAASGEAAAVPAQVSLQATPPAPGTLTGHDLRPAWRGKTASKAGI